MVARSDGKPFEREPIVDADYCVACGICAGSCPTATPFRRLSDLRPGIDLPDLTISDLREATLAASAGLSGNRRIIVFGCCEGLPLERFRSDSVGTVRLNCTGQLPPAFIDYVLSWNLADGVVLTGCREDACHARFGIRWTGDRLAGHRDPHLRARVPRERLKTIWAGRLGIRQFADMLDRFSGELAVMPEPVRRSAHGGASGRTEEVADA